MAMLLRSVSQWHMRPGRTPFVDESLYGYIAARAAEERIPTTLVITSLAGAKYGHRPEALLGNLELDNVADCLRVDRADLNRRTHPLLDDKISRIFFGLPISRFTMELRVRSYSPSALKIAPYHRALWALRALPVCVETGELLQDTCPFCNAIQRWHHANGIDRCDYCAQSLAEAQVQTVPNEMLRHLRGIAEFIHPAPERRTAAMELMPKQVQEMGPATAFDLLVILAGVVNPALRLGKKIGFKLDSCQFERCAAMATAWETFCSWPDGFKHLIAERLASRPTRFGDGNRRATIDFFERSARRDPPGVNEAIQKLRKDVTSGRSEAYNVVEAVEATGLRMDRILDLRRQLVIKPVFYLQDRVAHPLLDKASVEAVNRQVRRTVYLQRVAIELGITMHGVEQLAALGCLRIRPCLESDAREGLYFCRDSLDEFLAPIWDSPSPPRGVETVLLRRALRGTPALKAWGPVLQVLSNRETPCYVERSKGWLTDRISVRISDLPQLQALAFYRDRYPDFPFGPLMSKKDATTSLDLHPRLAEPLFAEWPSDNGPNPTVPVSAVEEIARSFVGPQEIALKLNISLNSAMKLARKVKLERVSPAGYLRARAADLLGI